MVARTKRTNRSVLALTVTETTPKALSDVEQSSLRQSLANFARNIGEALDNAAKDISTLEVKTFTTSSSDLAGLKYTPETNQLEGSANLKLRALTHIAFDGDMAICIPEVDGHIDQALWEIHSSMVTQAQTSRAEFFNAVTALAARLIDLGG